MVAPANKGGRPLKFKTVKELQDKIDEYFEWCDNRTRKVVNKLGQEYMLSAPAPYTMSGLARRLGIDRDTLINYSHREEYFGTIRDARERVHEDVEVRMLETKNEKGAIFSLKNNFGWKDESKTDVNLNGNITNTFNDDQIDRIAERIARRKGNAGGTSGEEITD